MSFKIVIIILSVCLLALAQASFLARFDLVVSSWLRYFNSIIVFVAIYSLFERRKETASFAAAFFGGVILDFYSDNFFGFWVCLLLLVAILAKFVIRKYVRIPTYW